MDDYRCVLHEQFLKLPWSANTPDDYLKWWCRDNGFEDWGVEDFFEAATLTQLELLIDDSYNFMQYPDYIPVFKDEKWIITALWALDPLPGDIKRKIMADAGLILKPPPSKIVGPSVRLERLMNSWKKRHLKQVIHY